MCEKCGESKSLGSALPKYQTTANLKNHLKSKHSETYTKYLKNGEELKSEKRPRNEEVFFIINVIKQSYFLSFFHFKIWLMLVGFIIYFIKRGRDISKKNVLILYYDTSGYMMERSQKYMPNASIPLVFDFFPSCTPKCYMF